MNSTAKTTDPRNVTYTAVEVQIEKFLLGKVLTVIDASYSDVVQREAVKNLIKDKFHSQVDHLLNRYAAEVGAYENATEA